MTALEKARIAKAKADQRRAESDVEHVAAYREFVRREGAAFTQYQAGLLTYSEWASMWAGAPKAPTDAQYANARRLTLVAV